MHFLSWQGTLLYFQGRVVSNFLFEIFWVANVCKRCRAHARGFIGVTPIPLGIATVKCITANKTSSSFASNLRTPKHLNRLEILVPKSSQQFDPVFNNYSSCMNGLCVNSPRGRTNQTSVLTTDH